MLGPRQTRLLGALRLFSISSAHPLRLAAKDVIRRLHPDLFATETQQVQDANLSCIQNLQEIISSLIEIHSQLDLPSQKTVIIRNPLRTSYDLLYFVRQDNSLRELRLRLSTPKLLTERGELSKSGVFSAFKTFATAFSRLWSDLKLDFPEVLMPAMKTAAWQADDATESEYRSMVEELGAHLFDNAITQKHQQQINNHPYADFKQKSRKSSRKHLELTTDRFLSSGQFLVQNVPITDEQICMSRFRSFLLEFGDLVNFNERSWRNIFVVVNGGDSQYSVRSEGESTVVTIPRAFKPAILIDFLQKKVESCRWFQL